MIPYQTLKPVLEKGILQFIIYILKCIVYSFLCQGRMLFCAFVDYSKAFDSVNRLRLWTKLLQFRITGKLFRVVQNIYKSIKSCVMINGISSLYFYSFVGVRQGENLSPLLFALFLNDIDSFCLSRQCSTLKYLDTLYARCNIDNIIFNLFLLLYADYTIVMAESETGFSNKLGFVESIL